jgi:hypothetical protein
MRNGSIAIVLLLAACGDARKDFDAGFRTAFEKNFVESCTTSAMSSGAPADMKPQVTKLCACIATTLAARHSTTELAAMGAGGNEELVQAAIRDCQR